MASKYYGTGSEVGNPFFPTETNWEGPEQTIESPVGSAYAHTLAKSNTFQDRLSESGAIVGRESKEKRD